MYCWQKLLHIIEKFGHFYVGENFITFLPERCQNNGISSKLIFFAEFVCRKENFFMWLLFKKNTLTDSRAGRTSASGNLTWSLIISRINLKTNS